MPAALYPAEVLRIHSSDATRHVFQRLVSRLSRLSNCGAERPSCRVGLATARQRRFREGLAPLERDYQVVGDKLLRQADVNETVD